MRQICICVLAAALVLSGIPGYAENSQPALKGVLNDYTLTGTLAPGHWLTLLVTDKSGDVDEENIIITAETETKADGSFRFSFKIPPAKRDGGSSDGDYYYRIGDIYSGLKWTGSFSHLIPAELSDVVAILSGSAGNAEIDSSFSLGKYKELLQYHGVLITEYLSLPEEKRLDICDKIRQGNVTEENFARDVVPAMNELILAAMVASAKTPDALKSILADYAQDFDIRLPDGAPYSALPEEVRLAVAGRALGTPVNGIEDVQNTVVFHYSMYGAENTTYQKMHSFITTYKNVLEIPDEALSYLGGLSENEQSRIYQLWKIKLANEKELTRARLNTLLQQSINETTTFPDPSPTIGTGGGGGGTVKGALPADIPVSDTEYVKNNTTDFFDDMEDVPWAKTAINALANSGVVRGVANRIYNPHQNVTRAEYLKLVISGFKLATHVAAEEELFHDVAIDDWYYYYVASAVRLGIVSGTGDGRFEPDRNITREEMAVMLYRTAVKANVKFEKVTQDRDYFTDQTQISAYASDAVVTLYLHQIISGFPDGTFGPEQLATRAQAASLVYTMLKSVNLI